MEKEHVLTEEGRQELEKEYRNLIDVQRPDVIEALQNARAMGDLSENADYDAARNRQAEVEGRIKEIDNILHNSTIVSSVKGKTINVSNSVKFKDLSSGEIIEVKIVSSIEANPTVSPIKISNECQLGNALIGHKEGDKVIVKTADSYEVEIIEVK